MNYLSLLDQRVRKAAKELDRIKPSWFTLITDPIVMSLGRHCVLGQAFAGEADQAGVYSGWGWAREAYPQLATIHADVFCCPEDAPRWRREINARLAAQPKREMDAAIERLGSPITHQQRLSLFGRLANKFLRLAA